MLNMANDYHTYYKILNKKNDLQEAKVKLNNVLELFKECDADGWVRDMRELAELQ